MKKVLFISHNASLTGAPILLLRLISLFKTVTNSEVMILLNQGGEIKNRFQELSCTLEWNKEQKITFIERFKIIILKRIGIKYLSTAEKHRNLVINNVNKVDYIFNNTIANAQLLRQLPLSNKKVISYVHELNLGCKIDSTVADMAFINEISNIIFVPSNAVKSLLVEEYQFDICKNKTLQYVIPYVDNSKKKIIKSS